MRGIHRKTPQRLEMIRQIVPAPLIGEEVADPGPGDVIGKEIVGDVGPTYRVVLRDAGPDNAVKLTGLHGSCDILPRQCDRNDAKLLKEPACGRKCKDTLTGEVVQAPDRILGREMAGIPGAG